MSRLSGQAAIVTGGAQGIGGATSRRLAEEGAEVLIADVDLDTASATAAAIADAGGNAVPMPGRREPRRRTSGPWSPGRWMSSGGWTY